MKLSKNTVKHLLRCGLITLTFSSVATAANFELSKHIEVGATATDNLRLADGIKETDLVFNLKPSLELRYIGNRFGVVALGQLEYLRFNESGETVINPRLAARVRGTLVDSLLFVDSKLGFSKISADNSFLRPGDDDETTAFISNTKIFMERSFGLATEFYADYTFTNLIEQTDDEFETNKHSVNVQIGHNPKYDGIIWGLGGYFNRDLSSINEFEDSHVYGKLGNSISRTVFAEATYGIGNREFINAVNTANPIRTTFESTPIWNVALNWSPSELTSLTVGYGKRFSGKGPNLQLKHRVRNSSILASYTRDISRQPATLNNVTSLLNNTNPSITDTDSVNINIANNLTPLDRPFVDNRFQLGYKLQGRRSDIIVDAVYSNQEPLTGSDNIKTLLGRVAFDRKLSDFMSLRFQYDYQKSKAPNIANLNYIENRFGIKFIYNFDGKDDLDEDQYEIE